MAPLKSELGVQLLRIISVSYTHLDVYKRQALAEGDMKKAQQICDSQRGSVANVVNATLKKLSLIHICFKVLTFAPAFENESSAS